MSFCSSNNLSELNPYVNEDSGGLIIKIGIGNAEACFGCPAFLASSKFKVTALGDDNRQTGFGGGGMGCAVEVEVCRGVSQGCMFREYCR